MEVWKIKDHIVEYDDATHTYFVDGIITQSCTQLLREGDDKYDNIPQSVLAEAARIGTLLHNTIESLADNDNCKCDYVPAEVFEEVSNWFFLKKQHRFRVLKNEVPIIIPYNGRIVAAGRFDLLLEGPEGIILADIKRTSKIYFESVSKQLTLYNRGLVYCYGVYADALYVVHLRKNVKEFRMVSFLETDIESLLERRWQQCEERLRTLKLGEIAF